MAIRCSHMNRRKAGFPHVSASKFHTVKWSILSYPPLPPSPLPPPSPFIRVDCGLQGFLYGLLRRWLRQWIIKNLKRN